MTQKSTTVINRTGIHARPATVFVSKAKKFTSKVMIKNENTGKQADAKSMLMLMTLQLVKGTPVTVTADGADEAEAVEALIALIDSGFGE